MATARPDVTYELAAVASPARPGALDIAQELAALAAVLGRVCRLDVAHKLGRAR